MRIAGHGQGKRRQVPPMAAWSGNAPVEVGDGRRVLGCCEPPVLLTQVPVELHSRSWRDPHTWGSTRRRIRTEPRPALGQETPRRPRAPNNWKKQEDTVASTSAIPSGRTVRGMRSPIARGGGDASGTEPSPRRRVRSRRADATRVPQTRVPQRTKESIRLVLDALSGEVVAWARTASGAPLEYGREPLLTERDLASERARCAATLPSCVGGA